MSGRGSGIGEMANAPTGPSGDLRGRRPHGGLHEFNLTAAGTALITAYESYDHRPLVSRWAAPAQCFAGHAQEIDVATGKVIFDWDSLSHVGVRKAT